MSPNILKGKGRPALHWASLALVLEFSGGCSRSSEGPPPPQTEVVVEQPGPDYVWVGGYWDWGWWHYHWVPGRWTHPPYAHAVWVGPRWDGGHRAWVRGYWR